LAINLGSMAQFNWFCGSIFRHIKCHEILFFSAFIFFSCIVCFVGVEY